MRIFKFGGASVKDAKGVMQIGIYTAELVNGEWSNVQPTSLNNPNYIVYHPSLSADGKHLYFASDMPDGVGGTDIYVADVSESGALSNVRNMGPIVNTEGNESFPFIHDSGNLYFSSDGHVGLGLLDVFVSKNTSYTFRLRIYRCVAQSSVSKLRTPGATELSSKPSRENIGWER